MKKITISIDDETYRKVRIAAVNRGLSISAMVREYLAALTDEGRMRAQIGQFRASDRLSRDQLHERKS